MKSCLFTGSCVALVTPMKQDRKIDLDVLDRLIEWQIAEGTDAVLVCATTGEASTLQPEEQAAIIRRAVQTVRGRVPVIAGAGSNDTRHAEDLSVQAEKLGADGLLLVTPYYNKTSQAGLIRHFTQIAERVRLPVILYNVPGRTGVNILPETYAALAEVPNIVGTKEANGDLAAAARTRRLCGADFSLYSGNDADTLPFLALGGRGVISVAANLLPHRMQMIYRLWNKGERQKSLDLFLQTEELFGALFEDVNPMPVKWAMQTAGLPVGGCRPPLCEPKESCKAHLAAILRKDCPEANI